jgi:ATP-dependent RNA helicase RhlE
MSFSEKNLDPLVVKYLNRKGITEATPIQAQTMDIALDGHDILAISQTGSGKTLAFTLPALTCLDEEDRERNRMLVLAPTRELAQQVHKVIEAIGRILELNSVCIFGGVSIDRQAKALKRGVDIIVATPGRLMDHMERGNIDFSYCNTLVIDEADRMLDMGFMPDIKEILSHLPEDRQTMLFSATFPKEIEKLTKQFMNNPKRIEIGRVAPAKAVRQHVYTVDQNQKAQLLQKILNEPEVESTIVFMRTKHRTDRITKTLKAQGIKAHAIHGGRTQSQRKIAIDAFRKGSCDVLVATDVAARGIDIQGVTHVINFDIPMAYDDYVHRIGRTARASADGDAITFVSKEDARTLRDIEKELGNKIPQKDWVGAIKVDTNVRGKAAARGGGAKPRSGNGSGHFPKGKGRNSGPVPGGKKRTRADRYKSSQNRANEVSGEGRELISRNGDSAQSERPRNERSRTSRDENSRSKRPSNGRPKRSFNGNGPKRSNNGGSSKHSFNENGPKSSSNRGSSKRSFNGNGAKSSSNGGTPKRSNNGAPKRFGKPSRPSKSGGFNKTHGGERTRSTQTKRSSRRTVTV